MGPCSSSSEVCKLVMFLVGAASIACIGVLLQQTIANFTGHGHTCHLWLDIVGRISLFSIGFYVAGLCGCIPFPDIFRPQRFPRPFLVWKLCTQCSGCLRYCARAFRICTRRTRTSSRTHLLQNFHYSPNLQQSLGPRLYGSGYAMSSSDHVPERLSEPKAVARRYPPEIEIFHFEESQPRDASELAEVYEECSLPPYRPPNYELQIDIPGQLAIPLRPPPPYHPPDYGLPADRPRHPVIPWGNLRLDKIIGRWPSDYDIVNLRLGLYENDPTSCICNEGLAKSVVKCNGCKKRIRTSSSHDRRSTVPGYKKNDRVRSERFANPELKGALKKSDLPETASKPSTSQVYFDSTRVDISKDAKDAGGASKKSVSSKDVFKLEDTAADSSDSD